jgi:RNA polymerase sigma-70 factor (ECF subfamily)
MDSTDQLYERLLVMRSQLGDEAALAELIARYAPKLRYLAGRMLAPGAGVEDVVQDVWVEVVRGLPRLAAAEAFKTWLYRIARDRMYGQLRKERRLPSVLENGHEVIAPADDKEPFDEDDIAALHAALARIPCEQREAVVLRFLEGLSYEEIARVTQTPVGTVRSRLFYGKQALRALIDTKEKPS